MFENLSSKLIVNIIGQGHFLNLYIIKQILGILQCNERNTLNASNQLFRKQLY
jgi:hypothetical protein